MKKMTILAVAALAISFASCKKEYTCECTTTVNGGSSSTVSGKTEKMKKKDAEAKCNEGDKTYDLLGSTYKVECTLK